MQYYRNFDLTNYNSFHLHSIANEIWFPENFGELDKLLIQLKDKKFYILARGTNVLLTEIVDKIICLSHMPKRIHSYNGNLFLVDANAILNDFVKTLMAKNLTGAEELLGIPGTVGGAIVGNSGSGSCVISNYLCSIATVNRSGEFKTLTKEMLNYKRRYSLLQDLDNIVLMASFQFFRSGIDKNLIQKTTEYRKKFPKGFSAGGIFKNWYALKPYETLIRNIPAKNIHVSEHLNVLINNGNATVNEILNYINTVKTIVAEPLEVEIKIL
jgi:UDP-N-acetylmuramate dehydrogenase